MKFYQLKNIIFFCFYILFRPNLLLLIFKHVYLPVYVQYEWLKKFKIGSIIDIGANRGNVTVALANLFPDADIYAFEPIKSEYKRIEHSTNNLKRVTVINAALNNKNGTIPFYINKSSPTSSMLPLSAIGKKTVPSSAKRTMVQAITLDDYFRNKKLKYPIFIKIDVQGAEKIVFEGGKNFLGNTSVIHIETGFESVYENQCLFGDIYKMLTDYGFVYHGNITDAEFYPPFSVPYFENSIFIKKSMLRYIQ